MTMQQCTIHRAEPAKEVAELISWEALPYEAYSPVLAWTDYHLFSPL